MNRPPQQHPRRSQRRPLPKYRLRRPLQRRRPTRRTEEIRCVSSRSQSSSRWLRPPLFVCAQQRSPRNLPVAVRFCRDATVKQSPDALQTAISATARCWCASSECCRARWRAESDSSSAALSTICIRACGASACATWRWRFPTSHWLNGARFCVGSIVSLGRLLGRVLPLSALHAGQRIASRRVSGLRKLRGSRETRQRRAVSHRALWRMGDWIVFSFPARASHADRGASHRQSVCGRPGHALPDAARQHRDRQTGIRARPAGEPWKTTKPSAS